jgi:hypothetical protein
MKRRSCNTSSGDIAQPLAWLQHFEVSPLCEMLLMQNRLLDFVNTGIFTSPSTANSAVATVALSGVNVDLLKSLVS